MTDTSSQTETASVVPRIMNKIRDFLRAFADLLHVPRAFWFINVTYMIASMAYFGTLTLMAPYLGEDMGLGDRWAGVSIGLFTMGVTLFMLGIGALAERLGVRRGVLFALILCIIGRIAYSSASHATDGWVMLTMVFVALLLVAAGEGTLQPICYAGIKQYTDEKTNAMGYGLIYALMNLGIFLIGFASSWVRVAVDDVHEPTH